MKFKRVMSLAMAAVLSLSVLSTAGLTAKAAEEPLNIQHTYSRNGFTFEKISHAASGTEIADGVVDYLGNNKLAAYVDGVSALGQGDSVQSYCYCGAAYGDWIYVGTMYGALSAYNQIKNAITGDSIPEGLPEAIIDAMYNGKLNQGKEADGAYMGSVFFKFNVKTGETKILMSRDLYNQGLCNGVPIFRSACEFGGKLYFVGLVSDGSALKSMMGGNQQLAMNTEIMMQAGVPCIYEVDPQNGDTVKEVYRCVDDAGYRQLLNNIPMGMTQVFTSTRAIGPFRDHLIAGGIQVGPVVHEGYAPGDAVLLAAKNPGDSGSYKVIAHMSDLFNYPAIWRDGSSGGGGIYQVVEFNNKLYVAIVSGDKSTQDEVTGQFRPFAIVVGECNGPVDEASSWSWRPLVGDFADGAKYTFGIDPERTASSAATLQVFGDHLYIGEYNDVNGSLTGILQRKSFATLAANLDDSINLYRMDKNENIEMVIGDPTAMFPRSVSGMPSGYASHLSQYTWMTNVYKDTMYLSYMDESSLLRPVAIIPSGEWMDMDLKEWSSQLNYLKVVLELLLGGNKTTTSGSTESDTTGNTGSGSRFPILSGIFGKRSAASSYSLTEEYNSVESYAEDENALEENTPAAAAEYEEQEPAAVNEEENPFEVLDVNQFLTLPGEAAQAENQEEEEFAQEQTQEEENLYNEQETDLDLFEESREEVTSDGEMTDEEADALIYAAVAAAEKRNAQSSGISTYALEEEIYLTDEQHSDLVSALKSGRIAAGMLSSGEENEMETMNRGLAAVAGAWYDQVDERFVETYGQVYDLSEKLEGILPESVMKVIRLLVNKDTYTMLKDFLHCMSYLDKSEAGFDLIAIKEVGDGVDIKTVTTNGFGDRYNHGLRIFVNTDDYMAVGTANPFLGTQLWRMSDYPGYIPGQPDPEEPPVNPGEEEEEPPVNPPEEPVVEICRFQNMVAAPKAGSMRLLVDGLDAGTFEVSANGSGWNLRNADGKYLAIQSGKLSKSGSPFAWSFAFDLFSAKDGGKTYYLSADRSGLTVSTTKNAASAVLIENVQADHHVVALWNTGANGVRTGVCTACGETVTENGAIVGGSSQTKPETAPGSEAKKEKVDVQVVEQRDFRRVLLWRRSIYTYSIDAVAQGGKVQKVEYSTNGIRWSTGDSYTSNRQLSKLFIRVTTEQGNVFSFRYQNGQTVAI